MSDKKGRKMRRVFLVGTLGAAVSIFVAAGAFALSTRDNPGQLTKAADRSAPVELSTRDRKAMEGRPGAKLGGPGGAFRIAVREGRAFYRLERAGGDCYSIGNANDSRRLGSAACSEAFPSAKQPVLNLSVIGGRIGSPAIYVQRGEGFAADGIASVGFLDAGGDVVGKTTVSDNVYKLGAVPSVPVTAFVAFDRAGAIVYREPLGPAPG